MNKVGRIELLNESYRSDGLVMARTTIDLSKFDIVNSKGSVNPSGLSIVLTGIGDNYDKATEDLCKVVEYFFRIKRHQRNNKRIKE